LTHSQVADNLGSFQMGDVYYGKEVKNKGAGFSKKNKRHDRGRKNKARRKNAER